jgi:hypothetical protein
MYRDSKQKQQISALRSNLTLLGSGHITCMKHTNCRVYSRLLLMMGTEDARNIQSFMTK